VVLLLSVIGIFAAVWAWQNVHPLVGVLVGFLFIGGAGWNFIGYVLSHFRPSASKAYGSQGRSFIAEWEKRFGVLRPGGTNHPPSGTFQAWLKANKADGISAGDWLDRQYGLPSQAEFERINSPLSVKAKCELLSLLATQTYPPMVMVADDTTITVHNATGSKFFDFHWDAVKSWEKQSSEELSWLLELDARKVRPILVSALRVSRPSDSRLWQDLLDRQRDAN
jgi:hypothetical protein